MTNRRSTPESMTGRSEADGSGKISGRSGRLVLAVSLFGGALLAAIAVLGQRQGDPSTPLSDSLPQPQYGEGKDRYAERVDARIQNRKDLLDRYHID